MTFIAILVLPLSCINVVNVTKYSQKYFAKQQQALGDVNGHIEEMYGGHNVVKAFNGEAASIKQFTVFNDQLYRSGWKSQFLSSLMHPLSVLLEI